MTDNIRLTPDVEAIHELRELVAAKRKAGDTIKPTDAVPADWPGFDDPHYRFQWWEWRRLDPDTKKMQVEGYFHTEKGVVL